MTKPGPLHQKRSSLPDSPGVYLMLDKSGTIIYIGKAASLKKRVSSYFSGKNHDIKTRVLVKEIHELDYIITDSEIEALLLENSLIKKHKPRYNIRLKDDKRYPYISVTLEEEYPRLVYTRRLKHNKNRFFGPYTDARAARNMINTINTLFKLKTCTRDIPLKKGERPCLNYQMGRCSGVCTGEISKEEYRAIIDEAIHFLEGAVEPVIRNLTAMMKDFSANMEYEKAQKIRDMIYDIQKSSVEQKVTAPVERDQDYIGVRKFGSEALCVLFEFRRGTLQGRKISIFDNAEYNDTAEILRSFILEYYSSNEPPSRIITEKSIEDLSIILSYLAEKHHRSVDIKKALTDNDRGIISLIQKNIDVIATERKAAASMKERDEGLRELQKYLQLIEPPHVIECFDISNLQGTDSVASMVLFREGVPEKSSYRRYRIKGYDQANDPAMIHEVVSRRLQHLVNEAAELPNLLVIDGGPTQLNRALEAVGNFELSIPVISLAKKREEVFTSPDNVPLRLPLSSPGLSILRQIRDEAHRFAITYHRTIRDKKTTSSELDSIPGISDRMKALLLSSFKSVHSVKQASLEELEALHGIGPKTARSIYKYFHGTTE